MKIRSDRKGAKVLIDWELAAPEFGFEIRVRDVQEARSFYRNVLGAQETFRRAKENGVLVRAGLAAGGVQFVVASEEAEGPEQALLSQLAAELGVPFLAVILKVDDPVGAAVSAMENGAVPVDAPDTSGVVVLTDPFGSYWAFVQREAGDQQTVRSSILQ